MQALNMPHQNSWYVQVNGQVYGPYSDEQMQGFCVEGRVNAYSILSQSPHNGFTQATQFQSFLNWSGRLQPQHQMGAAKYPAQQNPVAHAPNPAQNQILRPVSQPQAGVLARQMVAPAAPSSIAPSPTLEAQPISSPTPSPQDPMVLSTPMEINNAPTLTVFMVMAEIRSVNGMDFLQALQSQGTAQRIGDSLWLLQSEASVEQLRNVLSQTLTGDDRLFLLDSFANKTAWFNIGTNMDTRIRELWDIPN